MFGFLPYIWGPPHYGFLAFILLLISETNFSEHSRIDGGTVLLLAWSLSSVYVWACMCVGDPVLTVPTYQNTQTARSWWEHNTRGAIYRTIWTDWRIKSAQTSRQVFFFQYGFNACVIGGTHNVLGRHFQSQTRLIICFALGFLRG